MKQTFSLLTLALALLAASCAKDDVAEAPANEVAEAYCYLSVNIEMASADDVTRASIVNGAANETEIQDALFLLFKTGSTTAEDDAVLEQALFFSKEDFEMTNETGYNYTPTTPITKQKKMVLKLRKDLVDGIKDTGKSLYGLVILNRNGQFDINSSNHLELVSTSEDLDGKTFGYFRNIQLTKLGTAGNLLMTNAPTCADGKVTTLAKIDLDKVKDTEDVAMRYPSAFIFVERAAAKLTVVGPDLSGWTTSGTPYRYKRYGGDTESGVGLSGEAISYAVDNYNESFYVVRHMPTTAVTTGDILTWPRMVDNAPLLTTSGACRTYWAEDANYSGSTGLTQLTDFASVAKQFDGGFNNDLNPSIYFAENTMDADHMTRDCTTRVVIRAVFNNNVDFYAFADEKKIIQNNKTDLVAAFKARFKDATDHYVSELQTWLTTYITSAAQSTVLETGLSWPDNIVNGGANQAKCYYEVTITNTSDLQDASKKGEAETALRTFLQQQELGYYWYGFAYYSVPIKHFGADDTPWTAVNSTDYATVYPVTDRSKNFLGRYGVVRNNWYRIELEEFKQIGSPVVPPLTSAPDDKYRSAGSYVIHRVERVTE